MSEPESWPVKVYIYDLSKGMARSLSQAFLGKSSSWSTMSKNLNMVHLYSVINEKFLFLFIYSKIYFFFCEIDTYVTHFMPLIHRKAHRRGVAHGNSCVWGGVLLWRDGWHRGLFSCKSLSE